MSSRLEFTSRTKREAYARSKGVCECHLLAGVPGIVRGGCGTPLTPLAGIYYEHINQAFVRDDNSLGNCAVLTRTCWTIKTRFADLPTVARIKQRIDRNIGIRRTAANPFPGSRASKWKRTVSGKTILRNPNA
jgi:hypothetical protein